MALFKQTNKAIFNHHISNKWLKKKKNWALGNVFCMNCLIESLQWYHIEGATLSPF